MIAGYLLAAFLSNSSSICPCCMSGTIDGPQPGKQGNSDGGIGERSALIEGEPTTIARQRFSTPPLLLLIMLMTNTRRTMRDKVNSTSTNVLGWTTTVARFGLGRSRRDLVSLRRQRQDTAEGTNCLTDC
ncbi:hypothetical protein [Mesorhizobium sp. 1B3]|uniref:hypothetical protein n=1 Tax=Mesorhizobium sp. 1B3 TaxID=3243599 RepID=UPI003D998586